MDGWLSDEKCIARQGDIRGNIMRVEDIFHYTEFEVGVKALEDGKVMY